MTWRRSGPKPSRMIRLRPQGAPMWLTEGTWIPNQPRKKELSCWRPSLSQLCTCPPRMCCSWTNLTILQDHDGFHWQGYSLGGWEGPGTALWRFSWSTTALQQHNGARMLSSWGRSWAIPLDWMARWSLSETRHSADPGSLVGFLSVSSMELSNSVMKIDINKAKIFFFFFLLLGHHWAHGQRNGKYQITILVPRVRKNEIIVPLSTRASREWTTPAWPCCPPSYWYGSASRNMRGWLLLGLLQLTQADDHLAVLQPFCIKSNLHKKWDEIGIA